MTITVTSLPLNNNAIKRTLVGLLTASNSFESAAIPIPSNFSSTANPNSYFAISRKRPDHNPERGVRPLRLTMRWGSARRLADLSTLTETQGQRLVTPSAKADVASGTSSR